MSARRWSAEEERRTEGAGGRGSHGCADRASCASLFVTGGKWTTYRKMAQDAVDACVRVNGRLSHAASCRTEGMQLVGCDRQGAVCGGEYDR